MPKAPTGPKLVLYGPDKRHGAVAKKGLAEYLWYIRWYENGQKRERATGASLHQRSNAEGALRDFLDERADADKPPGGYRSHQVTVGRILKWYGTEHAPSTASAERIGYLIKALWPFWEDVLLSEVGEKKCKDYRKWRSKQATPNSIRAIEAWERRKRQGKKVGPKPKLEMIGDVTIHTELTCLASAISYARKQIYICEKAPVWRPDKGEPRDVWLTRSDFAKLLLAARQKTKHRPNGRQHLIVYLKVGIYQPARKEAILTLPLVQQIGGGAWIDADRGMIDFGPGSGKKKRPRHVPIHPRILVYVRGAKRRGQTYLVEYQEKRRGEGGRASDRKRSRPIANISSSFASAVKRAGLEKKVTPHSLRHTGVTWLKEQGLDSWRVGAYAGMTTETVERVYAHSHPDHLKEVVTALNRRRK